MCSVMLANKIMEILDQMVKDGKVFTAYDVTVAARATTQDRIDHDDVKGIIVNHFITGGMVSYNKDFRTLNLLSNTPFCIVYYPDTACADDHACISDSGSTASDGSTGSNDNTAVSTPAVDLGIDEVATTKEGRVQIPRKLTSQVTPNNGSFDVLINGTLKCATADARGDIRIGLKQFGITDSKVKLTVDATNNTISIETV